MSWIGTILSVANIGMARWWPFLETVKTMAMLSTMLLAGAYPGTWGVTLMATWKKGHVYWLSFAPVLHVALFFGIYFFTTWLERGGVF